LKVPTLGAVLLTWYITAGKTSETETPAAVLGPLFAVSVKVTLLPTFGVGLSTALTMLTLACGTGTGVLVDECIAWSWICSSR
jgi:hypothetical protein